jgi:hypothetical protein
MKTMRLGMIGQSEGNGHPWSWSAIMNGYDKEAMNACPFPAIPRYLGERAFPRDRLAGARVTHVWTQDSKLSRDIARACLIEQVVSGMTDMIGEVDAVILARDDYERHLEMSRPFLDAGLPIFVDKPLATTVAECERIWSLERYSGQVFTCSALRYASELSISNRESSDLGGLVGIEARVPKSWDLYAIHVIEPSVLILGDQGMVRRSSWRQENGRREVRVEWESGVTAVFSASGTTDSPIEIELAGKRGGCKLVFRDPFSAFKKALGVFVEAARARQNPIERSFVRKVVEIIEAGNRGN